MAKLTISVSRKLGRPNYGSVGCDLGVEIDLDETLFATEEDFAGEVARIGNKLRLSLTDELKKLVMLDAAEAAAALAERQELQALEDQRRNEERQERQSYDRTPPTEDRPTRRPPGNFKGKPKTGAGLFKVLMQHKDDGDPEPMRRVDAWSKKRKLPGRWLDWEPEDVEEACEVAGL